MSAERIVVVGGGAAGAAAAHTLARAGHEVALLEAAAELGGRTQTVDRDGWRLDTGAVYLLSFYARTVALMARVGGATALRTWSPPGALHDGRALHPVRYDFLPSFLRLPMLSAADRWRLTRKGVEHTLRAAPDMYDPDSLAAYDHGETMEAWSRRELGDAVHEHLVRAWVEPAFGVEAGELSTGFLLGLLKHAHRATFLVPTRGMGDVPRALTRSGAVTVHTGTPVERVRLAGGGRWSVDTGDGTLEAAGVVMACDAITAADLLEGAVPDDLRRTLAGVPYATMTHFCVGYEASPWPHERADLALPVGPGEHPVVGVIRHGRKSPGAIPTGAELVDVYLNDPFSRRATPAEAEAAALDAITRMFGPAPSPAFVERFHWERGLAVSPPGHYARMVALRDAMPPTLRLAGDFLAHLGVETAVVSGERAAHDLHGALVGAPLVAA